MSETKTIPTNIPNSGYIKTISYYLYIKNSSHESSSSYIMDPLNEVNSILSRGAKMDFWPEADDAKWRTERVDNIL